MSYLKTTEQIEAKGYRTGHRPSADPPLAVTCGEVFRSFVRLSACALAPRTTETCTSPLGNTATRSVSSREREYREELRRYQEASAEVFAHAFHQLVEEMEAQPFTDLLGPAFMERAASMDKSAKGIFFTPPTICKMMAKMLNPHGEAGRPLDVHEPAVGSGTMVLALAETLVDAGQSPLEMRVCAVDLDAACVDMSLINFSLWGVPAEVMQANTIALGAPGYEPIAVHRTMFWPLARSWRGPMKKNAAPLNLGPGSYQSGLFQ